MGDVHCQSDRGRTNKKEVDAMVSPLPSFNNIYTTQPSASRAFPCMSRSLRIHSAEVLGASLLIFFSASLLTMGCKSCENGSLLSQPGGRRGAFVILLGQTLVDAAPLLIVDRMYFWP